MTCVTWTKSSTLPCKYCLLSSAVSGRSAVTWVSLLILCATLPPAICEPPYAAALKLSLVIGCSIYSPQLSVFPCISDQHTEQDHQHSLHRTQPLLCSCPLLTLPLDRWLVEAPTEMNSPSALPVPTNRIRLKCKPISA